MAFVSCCNEQTPALTKVETLCVPLFSSVGPSHGAGRKRSVRRHLSGYCTNACKEHRHSLAHKKNTGTKLIPSILSWNQRNDLKTTFFNNLITPNNKKKGRCVFQKNNKKKGSPTYPKKGFLKASTSAQQQKKKTFRTIVTDCTSD